MKNSIKSFLKISFFLLTIASSNNLFASNEIISIYDYYKFTTNLTQGDDDWKVLVETKEISIYYIEITNNPCMSYKLKIVNHTNQKHSISFVINAKLADDCKPQYKTFSEFQYRKIEIEPNSTIFGDENNKKLLLPTTTSNIKDLILDFTTQ